ncbi:immunoglobulin E-set [Crepidotus variabilis]|uniref:Rho GDP-dissociation inhibitor n=1 Tax=Crepidotus variabilis TaxID=179855 RepID=A0A9P6ESR1_9AGAR|nr:immunoglobulin E-set [Crepidotus variabilis]
MSAPHDEPDDFAPSNTPGYKPTAAKTAEEYAKLDAEDESLARWKASLGIIPGAADAPATGPKVSILTLELGSPTLPAGKTITFNINDQAALAEIKKNPIVIKEGVEYNVRITFKVNHSIISGVRYIQIVKRAGVKVDKMEQMLGSYGPHPKGEAYVKNFDPEESPSGMLARSGTYNVRSRVIDDDGEVYADWDWSFKLAKEWS